mmetsp:Transcript_19456/g.61093  ORF Transcript_19456/g.61093 Transcript_19456/m.61093 type:complete len:230 (-) Transcript_19456:18-707(-)
MSGREMNSEMGVAPGVTLLPARATWKSWGITCMRREKYSTKSTGSRTSSSNNSVGRGSSAANVHARSWVLKIAPARSAQVPLGECKGRTWLRKLSFQSPSVASCMSSGTPSCSASTASLAARAGFLFSRSTSTRERPRRVSTDPSVPKAWGPLSPADASQPQSSSNGRSLGQLLATIASMTAARAPMPMPDSSQVGGPPTGASATVVFWCCRRDGMASGHPLPPPHLFL